MSFGAKPTKIDFENGVNIITGINGTGKSSIIEALSFCLFGKPYRNIKIKELINRRNKGNLKVSCEFVVDGVDEIIITRGMSPDILVVTKNNEPLELLSTKLLNQDEIDKLIGVNYNIFKQVISLAMNYNKPFLAISLPEKREIIEQIFNIIVFGKMLKNLKKQNAEFKTKKQITDSNLVSTESYLKSLKRRVDEMTEAVANFEEFKQKDIKINTDRIEQYITQKNELFTESEKLKKSTNETFFDKDSLLTFKQNRDEIVKKINENDYIIKTSKQIIESLNTATICPRCKTTITIEHKNKEINNLTIESNNASNENIILKQEKTKIDSDITAIENQKMLFDSEIIKLKTIQNSIFDIDKQLIIMNQQLSEINDRKLDFDSDSLNTEFDQKKEEYKEVWNQSKTITNTLKNNDIVQTILSETGIKSYFFKKLIPILNKKINDYINMFELPVNIQFDEFMNEKITNLDNLRNDISYYSYSEGEKKRIDLAILLAFINITKSISNWNCNILMIDELLDSAIDENGLDRMVDSIKRLTQETNDLCVYIISHRLQLDQSSKFSGCLNVKKNSNNFSEIINNVR